MVNAIQNTPASTWTPLGESLYEATRYFAQVPPAYTNSDYSYNVLNKDPYYFTSPWSDVPQYVKCCKSFVMIFTDGQPTQDLNIPSTIMDKAHTANAHAPVGFIGHCPGAAGCTAATFGGATYLSWRGNGQPRCERSSGSSRQLFRVLRRVDRLIPAQGMAAIIWMMSRTMPIRRTFGRRPFQA